MSGLRADEPGLQDCRYLVDPRHSDRISGNIDHDKVGIGLRKSLYNLVLTIRKTETVSVGVFTVLVCAFVQASDEYHVIGILRLCHCIGYELFCRPAFTKILTGSHAVVFSGDIAYIASLIDHLDIPACALPDSVQRRDFPLDLERGASSAHGHHLYGILAYYKYLSGIVHIHRKKAAFILQKDNAFASDLPGSRIMGFRTHAAKRTVLVHYCTVHESENIAHLIVKFFGPNLPAADFFQIRIGKIVVVISIAAAAFQSVSPAAEFHVQPVTYRLTGIVGAAPVGNHNSVIPPLAAEDIVQGMLIMAAMLVLIKVV